MFLYWFEFLSNVIRDQQIKDMFFLDISKLFTGPPVVMI